MGRKKAAKSEEPNAMDETQNNTEGETMDSGRKKTVRQYWIEVLTAHPSWLQERSNERLFKEFLKDHPEFDEVPTKARQGLSTVKSLMRKEFKDRKRGRKADAAETDSGTVASATAATGAPRTRGRSNSALEALEERIDDVLTQAKSTEGVELAQVVQLLKAARNSVIVLLHKG